MSTAYLQDLYFVAILLQMAACFSIAYMFLKGMWWLCIIAGLSWILLGLGSMFRTEIFYFQRTLAIVFMVIGIGMFFMPAWFKRRDQKSGAESLEDEDVKQYRQEMNEYQEGINQYRKLGMRKRKY
jgi:membrane-bound metal-dependent hydrolase YbcI (DUF457 family)